MSLLLRVALLAYPREFRRRYGTEWTRTIADMRTHGQQSSTRVAATVISETANTALRMRWEHLMPSARITLSVLAAVVMLVALMIGSPAIAVLVVAIVILVGLQFAGKDRPITPSDPSVTRRWWTWLATAAAAFLVGIAVIAIAEEDGGLSSAAWAIWMISWVAAAVLAAIGLGLGATRLVLTRR